MNKLRNSIVFFSLAILAFASMALFTVTPQSARAQSGTRVAICYNPVTGDIKLASSTGGCEYGFDSSNPKRAAGGVCKVRDDNTGDYGVVEPDPDPITGSYANSVQGGRCVFDGMDASDYPPFVSFDSMGMTDSTPLDMTPPGATQGGTPASGTPKPASNATPSTKPPVQIQGNCETGFHKVGPLCSPNSPFDDPNAPVNSPDPQGLAVRLVKILLYFAGIVAVIMAIIGGYQIMTSAGNTTQAANGRKTLTNAIIGLVIVILSYVIIQAVISFVTKS